MEMKRGRDEIHERRFVTDLAIAEQLCGRDVSAATIATVGVAIVSEIAKQLKPLARVIFIQRPTARSLDAKPDSILIHYASDACERQAVIPKRLAMPRRNCIDGTGRMSDDLLCSVTCFSFIHRRETSQPLSPKLLSFEPRHRRDFVPVFVDQQELNSVAQRITQQHMPLSRRVDDPSFDDNQ